MKFINKFFSWTLIYKTFQFIESIFIYLKDYYHISDILYSDEFRLLIKKYVYINLKKDWIGRLYGVINPNIGANGKYDFSNSIFEIDGDNTNNDEFIKNILYGKLDLIDRQFHINKLYNYITMDIQHVGPVYADNYLIIIDMVARKYMSNCFKSWFKQLFIYSLIALIIFFIII